jgi:transcriptional antiterminator RfaH
MAVSTTCLREYDDSFHWLVLQIKAQSVQLVEKNLVDRGLEPYCPHILAPPWHRRAPRRPIPLFPGYMFVHCHAEESFGSIRFCPGVIRPVMFENRLATVGPEVVFELRTREAGRGYILPDPEAGQLKTGQRVLIGGGPMRGLEGVFQGYMRGGERAQVLIDFLRSQRHIEVDATALAAVRD